MNISSKVTNLISIALMAILITSTTGVVFAADHKDTQVEADRQDNEASNHPSGNDRNTEHGHSYPQGNSHSNPDGNGVDKPFTASGQSSFSQGRNDNDGNNGCGNDNDFSDDNNGKCLGPIKKNNNHGGNNGGGTGGSSSSSSSASSSSSDSSSSNAQGGTVLGTSKLPDTTGSAQVYFAWMSILSGLSLIGLNTFKYLKFNQNQI